MFSQTEYGDDLAEQAASLIGGQWYENDLLLAAELGKTLLERNRDLEAQLKQAQQMQWESQREADLLSKQLDVLRNVSESRARLYEEVDHNAQELEKANEKLRHEAKMDKGKIERLTNTVETLEGKCDDLQTQINDMKSEERERRRKEKRTLSVPSINDLSDHYHYGGGGHSFDYLGFPAIFSGTPSWVNSSTESKEMKDLKDSVKSFKRQLNAEKRRKENVEAELAYMTQEHQNLVKRVAELEEEQRKVAEFEDSRRKVLLCRECGGRNSMDFQNLTDQGLIEHDLNELPRGEVHRLKNGGSAYGSRESLNMLGLQTEGMTPTVEIARDILAAGFADSCDADDLEDRAQSPANDVSLLGELEEQYRKLVQKYEALIEAKSKRAAEPEAPPPPVTQSQESPSHPPPPKGPAETVMRPSQLSITPQGQGQTPTLDFRSPLDILEGRFDHGPPEYKRLFKEIFETLRRSVVIEDDNPILQKPT